MIIDFVLTYLIVGLFVAVLGFWCDAPTEERPVWFHVAAFCALIIIWPFAVFVLAKHYRDWIR